MTNVVPTEFHIEIVTIGPVEKHPHADTLSITKIHGGYPVIFRTGDYLEGERAVYVPVDAVVPTDREPFRFLATPRRDVERVKAKRVRGIFSMGLLVPVPDGIEETLALCQTMTNRGVDLAEVLGITKHEENGSLDFVRRASPSGGSDIPIYGINGLRKYAEVLIPGERVVITEKLHGCSARVFHDGTQLWVGSHRQWLSHDGGTWRTALAPFEEQLSRSPNRVVYGEVYGTSSRQDLKYGVDGARFAAFDVWDRQTGSWLDHAAVLGFLEACGMAMVPVLYTGPWSSDLAIHAEGVSTLAGHVREGFVVKPQTERWDERVGRVILKLHGEGYLTRKGG